jgi:hypothetical protein
MEKTLYKARQQLKSSKSKRDGDIKYEPAIRGGKDFSKDVRKKLFQIDSGLEKGFLGTQHDKDMNIERYFQERLHDLSERAWTNNR